MTDNIRAQVGVNDQWFETIHEQLESISWPESLLPMKRYAVATDDSDGKPDAPHLSVVFSDDGDAWVSTTGDVRIRSFFGGGHHHLVRAALIVLAWAINAEGATND